MDTKFIASGVVLMILAALLFIFIPIGAKEIIGISMIFFVGFGLTVAGSPDPRKE